VICGNEVPKINCMQAIARGMVLALLVGCTKPGDEVPMNSRAEREEKNAEAAAEPTSADYLLSPGDVENFRSGRLKGEILGDIHWRGNFEMGTQYDGHDVCAISFGLFGGPFGEDPRGTILWAVFVDDKFQKFVKLPEGSEKPLKVGEFRELILALHGEPVSVSDLEKDVKPETPHHVDPGLTVAVLPLLPALDAKMRSETKKNAELRDQFNASRLKLGMTEGQVELVLRAKPIESGEFSSGSWRLYGSTDEHDVRDILKYSNILVLFKSGTVSGIYSGFTVPGGAYGIRSLRESVPYQGVGKRRPSFSDLPSSKPIPK
jgi:hypothetical protein